MFGNAAGETGIVSIVDRLRAYAVRLSHPHWGRFHFTRFWLIVLLIAAPILAVCGSLIAAYWPYRYSNIHFLLEGVFGNTVKIGSYHRTYFPHPGFVASHLTILRRENPGDQPLGTVETISAESYWSDFIQFRNRVRLVEVTRLHLLLPEPGTSLPPSATSRQAHPEQGSSSEPTLEKPAAGHPAKREASPSAGHAAQPEAGRQAGTGPGGLQFTGPQTPIGRLTAHNSTLDIARPDGGRYTFAIRNLELLNMERGRVWHYSVDMENALPAAHIAAKGDFGPLKPGLFGATPLSGQFTVKQLKLSNVGTLRGNLSASGHFEGKMQTIKGEAISDTPDFAVGSGHPTPVHGSIRFIVDALNGDVFMTQLEVQSGQTVIRAHGQVAGSPKITELEIAMDKGRVEDVLRPFSKRQVPVDGPATLHAHAYVAAPGKPFLERLQLVGHFDAPAEVSTEKAIEQKLSAFSRREVENAQDPRKPAPPPGADAISSIQGPATIRKGVISTPGIVFRIPGASATLHGTFALEDQAVHLAGTLEMAAGISHAVAGWKSVVLKLLQPVLFHRHRRPGSSIPIVVVGTGGHYTVKQNVM